MNLKRIHHLAPDTRAVNRGDWRTAAKAFDRCGIAGVTPAQAARVLDATYYARMMVEALAAKSQHELAGMVCTLLSERRIPRRRKDAQ